MANAALDENGVATLISPLEIDGRTIVRIQATEATNSLRVGDGTTGTDHGPVDANRDENSRVVMVGVSSADGQTPVVIYADSDGNLLIDSH
jgi:hypothetical protein